MRAEYLVMFDGEESGRLFCTNTAAISSFGSLFELRNQITKGATAVHRNVHVDWDRLSIDHSMLLTLWVTVVNVDDCGLHGFVRNGIDYDCFADTYGFYELIQKRVHTEVMHRRKAESSRLSKRRAKEARAIAQLHSAIKA